MMRSRTRRMTLMFGAGSAIVATGFLSAHPVLAGPSATRQETGWSAAGPVRAVDPGDEGGRRAFGLSAAADIVRAGGTAGVATGGGLMLGLVTGPAAGIPAVGPTLADQATRMWGKLQASIADGAVAFADAMSQAADPLAPGLNQIGEPTVTAADSLASSASATEEHLSTFGLYTNLVSYPFRTGSQLARALS